MSHIPHGLRYSVITRDKRRCVVPTLDPTADACQSSFGWPMEEYGRYKVEQLQLDHVRDEPMMGRTAPSDEEHLVTVCPHHHLDGWATAHRPALREYLNRLYPSRRSA